MVLLAEKVALFWGILREIFTLCPGVDPNLW